MEISQYAGGDALAQTVSNECRSGAFRLFLIDRMRRANMTCKDLHAATGVPYNTIRKYRQQNTMMPPLYEGLVMLEAIGSRHAVGLLEIWRTWYPNHC